MATYVVLRQSKTIGGRCAAVDIDGDLVHVRFGNGTSFEHSIPVMEALFDFVRECIGEYQVAQKARSG